MARETLASMLRSLDAASRLRVRAFAFKALVIIPISLLLAGRRGFPLIETLAFFCLWSGSFAAITAVVQRQSYTRSLADGMG
jgi:hypothetical protein